MEKYSLAKIGIIWIVLELLGQSVVPIMQHMSHQQDRWLKATRCLKNKCGIGFGLRDTMLKQLLVLWVELNKNTILILNGHHLDVRKAEMKWVVWDYSSGHGIEENLSTQKTQNLIFPKEKKDFRIPDWLIIYNGRIPKMFRTKVHPVSSIISGKKISTIMNILLIVMLVYQIGSLKL